jgi:hypothetical protein
VKSNTVTGRFTVEQATFGTDSAGAAKIQTFAATVEQHCEGAVPALFGTFVFDLNPVPAPVPVAPMPSILAIAIAAFVALRRSNVCDRVSALGSGVQLRLLTRRSTRTLAGGLAPARRSPVSLLR